MKEDVMVCCPGHAHGGPKVRGHSESDRTMISSGSHWVATLTWTTTHRRAGGGEQTVTISSRWTLGISVRPEEILKEGLIIPPAECD